jgi:hypothetical protein
MTKPCNIVVFCKHSLNNLMMNNMIRQNNGVGLSDPSLDIELQAGNYEPVLQSLWCEKSEQRRLEWLQGKAKELHPILMFELAIAKFDNAPTAETVNSVSIPLIEAAAFRVWQDSQCSKDLSVKYGDAEKCMFEIYIARLKKQVKLKLNCTAEDILNQSEREPACLAKVQETAQASIDITLPSPRWVGWHGQAAHSRGAPNMYPENEHKRIRDDLASTILDLSTRPL